ncbi:MAG: hypothetical protein R2695_00795 [Acidimicrobiales bacterium]
MADQPRAAARAWGACDLSPAVSPGEQLVAEVGGWPPSGRTTGVDLREPDGRGARRSRGRRFRRSPERAAVSRIGVVVAGGGEAAHDLIGLVPPEPLIGGDGGRIGHSAGSV